MNAAYAHLVLTHVPVLGTGFGLFLLLLGMIKASDELKRTGTLVFALCGLAAIGAYMTGESAEETLKKLHNDVTEQHSEIAVLALTASLLLAIYSGTGLILFRRNRPIPKWFFASSIALAALTFAVMAWTANLGGKIRHPEIAERLN